MTLTTEQKNAVDLGEPVMVEIEGDEYILIRRDVFENTRRTIDVSDMSPEEAYAAIEEAWGDDPGLDAYQDLKR